MIENEHETATIERREYPAGVPCWIDLAHPSPWVGAGFYSSLFGWRFDVRTPDGACDPYLVATLDGLDVAAIATQPAGGAPQPATWRTWIAVDDADAAGERAHAAGGRVLEAPFDVPGAGRAGAIADPDGTAVRLWEPGGHTGAQLVNAPGTWNWSDLNVRDPQRAAAFYGAVFGWEAERVGAGDGGESWMWRLPGYGDFLAERDPDMRRRHEEAGVPSGFGDAIGWLAPLPDDATPPHWGVTFAVEDADATAASAWRLGGEVVVPPFDAGGVARVAVLRDPQGAAFTVSRYTR